MSKINEFGMLQPSRHVHQIETVNEINVLAQIHINQEVSQRKISHECNVSKTCVQKILKKHHFHDYKLYRPVQTIHPRDAECRLEFCYWGGILFLHRKLFGAEKRIFYRFKAKSSSGYYLVTLFSSVQTK